MRLVKSTWAGAFGFLILFIVDDPGFAQRPAAKVAPEKLEAARNLLEITNADAQFTTIIPLMFRQMRQSIPSAGDDHKEQIDQVFKEIEEQFLERRKEIIDQIAVLYAHAFSAEEMNALSDFYRSPVGQKFIKAMPQLAAEAMALGNVWGRKIVSEAQEKIREELEKRGLRL